MHEKQHNDFLEICPKFERHIVDSGIRLIKYWLEVGNKEQKRRFEARIDDRLRQWKLSNIDLPSRERWYDYSRARDMMLEATDTDFAPWYLVSSNDKKRARLNVLSHFLSLIPYEAPKRDKIKLPTRDNKNAYDDESTIKNRRWIEREILRSRGAGLAYVGFHFCGKRLHELEDRGDVFRQKRVHETRNVLSEVSESVRRYISWRPRHRKYRRPP